MADFNTAYQISLGSEGGYTDHPNDKGNYTYSGELVGTNYGINAMVYEDWFGFEPDVDDMLALKLKDVKEIYKNRFWDKVKGDLIQSQQVANIIFDMALNSGHRRATRTVQVTLQQLGHNLTIDGKFGPVTLAEVNSANQATLHNEYKEARRRFYNTIATGDNSVFLKGWLNRLDKFPEMEENDHSIIVDNTNGDPEPTILMVASKPINTVSSMSYAKDIVLGTIDEVAINADEFVIKPVLGNDYVNTKRNRSVIIATSGVLIVFLIIVLLW